MAAPTKQQEQTCHLVRHAQGFHNLSYENHSIRDPLLTEFGKEQCQRLQSSFRDMDSVDLVVASALKRTIYTALLAFEPAIARGKLRVVAMPELQETSDLPCDTGSDLAALEREFAGLPVDLGLVAARPDWTSKKGDWAPWADPINARARRARQWLRARPERNIVVVSHGGFLHYFTEDFDGFNAFNGTGWDNTEFRSYTFDPSRAEYASLLETPASRARRHVVGGEDAPSLSDAERENLRRTAEKSWEEKGYVGHAPAAGAVSKAAGTAGGPAGTVQSKV